MVVLKGWGNTDICSDTTLVAISLPGTENYSLISILKLKKNFFRNYDDMMIIMMMTTMMMVVATGIKYICLRQR